MGVFDKKEKAYRAWLQIKDLERKYKKKYGITKSDEEYFQRIYRQEIANRNLKKGKKK